MSRRSTYQERYDSQGYFAPGDVLDDSASGTETTSNEVIDGSPGAAKRINAKPYEPVDYSKNPYENSNNEYLKPVTPGNAEPTVVKGKSGPTKPSGKKAGANGGSGGGGGGGNCPCAEEKKKQTQTGADIKAKAEQAATTGATGSATSSTGGSGSAGGASGGGTTSTSGSGGCDCEHEDSVIDYANKVKREQPIISNDSHKKYKKCQKQKDYGITYDSVTKSANKIQISQNDDPQKATKYNSKTGTALYTIDGQFIGFIASSREFQVHFIDYRLLQNFGIFYNSKSNFDAFVSSKNSLPRNSRDKFTDYIRKNSAAFIGENSIKTLMKIVDKSTKMGKYGTELGYYSEQAFTKELFFQEFTVPDKEYLKKHGNEEWGSHRYPLTGVLDWYYEVEKKKKPFVIGHTHTAEFYNVQEEMKPFGGVSVNKSCEEVIFETYNDPSGVGGDLQYFNSKNNKFDIVAFPGGFTIYPSASHSEFSKEEVAKVKYESYTFKSFFK